MNARMLVLPAAAAAVVVVAGVVARPLLPSSGRDTTAATVSVPPVPPQAVTVATRIAVGATRCQPQQWRGSGCGRLTVTNIGAYRADDGHVFVELVGRLDNGAPATPLAMRVLVTASAHGWTAAVVKP